MPGFILQNGTGLYSDKLMGQQGLPVSQTKCTTGTASKLIAKLRNKAEHCKKRGSKLIWSGWEHFWDW